MSGRRTALMFAAVLAVATLAACGGGSGGRHAASPATTRPAAPTTPSSSPVPSTAPVATSDDWPQYHHDAAHHGVAAGTTLMGAVRRAWASPALDGAVYAEPLAVGGAVIVATEGNSVYSLDATTGAQRWRAALGPPVPGSALPCGNIDPSGITGTPVIDVAGGTVYVVAFLRAGPRHELFALDLASGAVRWHRPIDPPGLSANVEQERGALALANGLVYVPFGGLFGDCGNYKGAIVSSPVDGRGAMGTYTVPTAREAGIWASPGPAIDSAGDLWFTTGNSVSRTTFDFGNAVVRLGRDLTLHDWFASQDWAALNRGDIDLGSLGPILLPGGRAMVVGKNGIAYLLRRDALGHEGGEITSAHVCSGAYGGPATNGPLVYVPCNDGVVALRFDGDHISVAWHGGAGSAGSPVVAGGAVWAVVGGSLTAFDATTGAVRATQPIGRTTHFVSAAASGGRLYVPTANQVVAFAYS